ncbi:hypothetical protein H4696_000271 [Amycolatopsis lexingtonensis]|uniref:TrbL/VirB6 plasmid conjugal transfer protein n=1 Tax=Amycolatopsis lexingtonensis TaxID=218822 RepID=A0ABR9HQF9_9PSEU|nr:hypothetical protein [Amycolatopsis lexingtonensis]MBE1493171.1 hypothetical protein [Amycolatopsis lexingtonensis]
MSPLDLLDTLGGLAGKAVSATAAGIFEPLMKATWASALFILRTAFELVDQFSLFTVSTTDGPVSILWPMTLWISGAIALGMFFWQIITTVLHGGRGFVRLITGPIQYGIALAVTVGVVAAFLAAADGLTEAVLSTGLQVGNFRDALTMTGFTDALSDEVKNIVLGLAGAFGVIPAGLGFAVEAVFREATIYVVVATVPIAAAGLVAEVTARWYWKLVRWGLVAIVMKPALAFVLVLAVAIVGGAQGLSGLLAGIGVLFLALCVPLVLFKLFAFVDPDSDPQGAFRDKLSDAGLDSYGANSVAGRIAGAFANKARTERADDSGDGGGEDGGDGQEQANVDRFDQAAAEDDTTAGPIDATGDEHTSGDAAGAGTASGSGGAEVGVSSGGDGDSGTDPAEPSVPETGGPGAASVTGAVDDGDGDIGQSPPPDPPGDTGPPTPPTPKPDNGPRPDDGGAAAGEAEEAAVLL